MRLVFLASKNIGALADFTPVSPNEMRLLFVPTASDTYENPCWLDEDKKALTQMGFNFDEIDIKDLTPEQSKEVLSKIDIVYLAGGNTFHLLHHLNKSGFGQAIKDRDDLHFAGGSAGAVVAGPDIEPIGPLDDPTAAPYLQSTAGLNLVPFVVLPHYDQAKNSKQYSDIIAKYGTSFELTTLTDTQVIVVKGNERHVVESA